jgi:BirA family transcriptional regulator, biotin operon repressor / biotin---[acetyl-CoA-carboxylase] ligase
MEKNSLEYQTMKTEILTILKKNKDSFVSGQDISQQIGMTRASVWKYIKQLQSEGYLIESVSKNGYRLQSCPDILTSDEVGEVLKTDFIGHKIIHFDSIDSTNNKARELAELGASEGTVVISEAQTKGKGKTGREWFSKAYKGICVSIILRPNIALLSVPLITQIACAAVGKAVENLTKGMQIKWPNDVLLNGMKICGILTESSGEVDKIDYIILGIGVNVNQDKNDFPKVLEQKATSLKIMTKKQISRKNLISNILYEFEKQYILFKEHEDIDYVVGFCRKYSSVIGKQILLERNDQKILAKAIDINNRGQLLLQFTNGSTESISIGDISIL